MPTQRKSCRKAAAGNIIRLVRTLHKKTYPVFQCSLAFRNQPYDPDHLQPLDLVNWDCQTKRYQMVQQSTLVWDDAVLQAMCMLFIVARVQHGWKQEETCAQLTVWPQTTANSGVLPLHAKSVVRQWDGEIEQLIRQKQMSKKHRDSNQNFNSFASIYSENHCGFWTKEHRKNSAWAPFYEISEHSVVQWALEYRQEYKKTDELALVLLKHLLVHKQLNASENIALATTLHDMFVNEGVKDKPETFCKNLLAAMEDMAAFESEIASFRPAEFLRQYLPHCGENQRMRGIYRSPTCRLDLKIMVKRGEYPE